MQQKLESCENKTRQKLTVNYLHVLLCIVKTDLYNYHVFSIFF